MTIKINGMIQKLNPSDQYKLINIADVEGGSDLPQRTQSLETSIQVLNSNIAQKPDGLAVGSTQGQTLYHDQTEIEFGTGFEVINTGTKSKVNGTTELTVSNGQEEDSTVVTGKALEFPDATLTVRDPSGAQVIVVDVPQGSGGDDPYADIDLSMLDEVFNKELMGSVEFLNASTGSLTIPNLPVGAIVYAKQAFRKLPTGGIRPVTKLGQTYNNGVLQMSFRETSDVLVIIGVLLL